MTQKNSKNLINFTQEFKPKTLLRHIRLGVFYLNLINTCHSLQLPFKPRFLKIRKNNRRHIEICRLLFWCEKRDLNPYGVTTRPSNVRVCQFRHSRVRRLASTFDIILRFFWKVNTFFQNFLIYFYFIIYDKLFK